MAEYVLTARGITVYSSSTLNLPPEIPRVETFYVPAKDLKAAKDELKGYLDLYFFALEHSVPMTLTGGESKMAPKCDYLIMSFCKDRLLPQSSMEMKVTERRNMRGKVVAKTAYMDEFGWRVMVAGGEFRPGSASNKFYIGVRYKADPKSTEPPFIVAAYENRKRAPEEEPLMVVPSAAPTTATTPVVPSAQSQATSAPAASAPGPIEQGTRYLNLGQPGDVGLIQQRLKELGYYKSVVDGALGPMTKSALDSFARQNNFKPGYWTMDMQQLMFRGTGKSKGESGVPARSSDFFL